ncbi:Rieske 2Fe-2S domain-containing protein [Humisphaera borealis]|uniref:Ferric reductase-like transmembrane domain-containing protein n=1 Tax=Humisphaera borealis TaxID=2807512 RepID=A0A7M2WVY1_9BACT|nr:Rieske 2Fe-2S domain-containing protein [Humisphaera borealis]QOV89539.1 ferric reductase-like transmembrane domain-containing protein [Humisphaera borealis]
MSVGYRAIQWNPNKVRYDLIVAGAVVLFIAAFVVVTSLIYTGDRSISPPILLMRAFGACAIVMLHVILCIGPLARLDRRFLPLLYNRRHLGVMTFAVALLHALAATGFYHGFGVVSAPYSLLTSNLDVASVAGFPFEWFGALALVVLFLMAATSHDFWLKNLSPRVWKALHMSVYLAWASLIAHVALGSMQSERGAIQPMLLIAGVALVGSLHLVAGRREAKTDAAGAATSDSAGNPETDWIDACAVSDLIDGRGKVVPTAAGERIALYRQGAAVSAISNVCAHQGGPLGEGRIIDGCVTCPWHGYQYRAADGCAPPPFTEKLPTYRVRVVGDRVQVHRVALPPGTAVEPAAIT